MSTATLARHIHFAPIEHSRILFLMTVLARRIRRRMKIRSDRKFLQSMPDHMLADIGISRSTIGSAVEYGRLYDGR